MEWGIGQILPLKKGLSMLLQPGLIGYDQWQVIDNGGLLNPNVPACTVPQYAVHAVGFQTNYLLPAKALNFFSNTSVSIARRSVRKDARSSSADRSHFPSLSPSQRHRR
jgi:hypothetical protein